MKQTLTWQPITRAGLLLGLVALGFGLQGCAGTKVERVDAAEEIALTDQWNATDSRLVADSMIDDMLSFPWIERFQTETGQIRPVIIIQSVDNRSHQQIPVETFINDLRRAGIRSGRVDFVAAADQRGEIRDERSEQQNFSRPDTVTPFGEEIGADFALSGTITSIVDQLNNRRVTFYQTDLVLIDLKTNRQVWAGQNKIQKIQQRSRFGF